MRLIRTILPLLALVARADDPPKPKHTNHLARETSPYLLQHAHNPVDWYPWGPEALAKAKKESKPIFLSVGYSSCYWCHVMERESFEDEAIAKTLNEHFVCIKVDREERPDVDQVYMAAVQALNDGHGGWPMSVFLLPDGRPFFGGTYYPAKQRDGLETFPDLLGRVIAAWRDHRKEIDADADQLAKIVRASLERDQQRFGSVPLTRELARKGQSALVEQYDPEFGGFGFDPLAPRRPKFPEPANLLFLMERHRREPKAPEGEPAPLAMVLKTLDEIERGGIHDHLGGGYHRYSVDRRWEVPHFEKMLYDNAQLASAFARAHEATGDQRWSDAAQETVRFLAARMLAKEGGFFSSFDAESGGGDEGGYYAWTKEQAKQALAQSPKAELPVQEAARAFPTFARAYGLDGEPNFEGERYVLRLVNPPRDKADRLLLSICRERLLLVREPRPSPRLDDKILTSWNGLALAALADAYAMSKASRRPEGGHRPLYFPALCLLRAEEAAQFLLTKLRAPDGRLLRSYRAGQAKGAAYLEDYAYLAHGFLRLHAATGNMQLATGNKQLLDQAKELTDRMLADFQDDERGGFYFTADDHEGLLARPKDPFDGALPSANGVAIRNLVALGKLTGEAKYLDAAGKALRSFAGLLDRNPGGAPTMLMALDEYLDARPDEAKSGGRAGTSTLDDPLGLGTAKPVLDAKAEIDPKARPAPGAEIGLTITLTIRDGWHLGANAVGKANVRPTVLSLAPGSKATLIAVEYPEGKAKTLAAAGGPVPVYEGTIKLPLRVRFDADAPTGRTTLKFQVRHQACDDRVCLAPGVKDVPLEVEVGGK